MFNVVYGIMYSISCNIYTQCQQKGLKINFLILSRCRLVSFDPPNYHSDAYFVDGPRIVIVARKNELFP